MLVSASPASRGSCALRARALALCFPLAGLGESELVAGPHRDAPAHVGRGGGSARSSEGQVPGSDPGPCPQGRPPCHRCRSPRLSGVAGAARLRWSRRMPRRGFPSPAGSRRTRSANSSSTGSRRRSCCTLRGHRGHRRGRVPSAGGRTGRRAANSRKQGRVRAALGHARGHPRSSGTSETQDGHRSEDSAA